MDSYQPYRFISHQELILTEESEDSMVLAHTKIESPAKEKIPHYNTLEVYVNKL